MEPVTKKRGKKGGVKERIYTEIEQKNVRRITAAVVTTDDEKIGAHLRCCVGKARDRSVEINLEPLTLGCREGGNMANWFKSI